MNKPTYQELAALVIELSNMDWYATSDELAQQVFKAAERIEDSTAFEQFQLDNPELTEQEALVLWNTSPEDLAY